MRSGGRQTTNIVCSGRRASDGDCKFAIESPESQSRRHDRKTTMAHVAR
jgi:hypothetical protein